MMTEEKIRELEAAGCKRWQKYGKDRLYIPATALGLEIEFRRTGSVFAAWWRGERISNSLGGKLSAATTYIDLETGLIHGWNEDLVAAATELSGCEVAK